MRTNNDYRVSDQQYHMLEIVWKKGEVSVADVQADMPGKPLAYTTVATVLTRLEKKGILAARKVGREKIYRAEVAEKDVRHSMVGSMLSTVFKGDTSALLAHLIEEGDLEDDALNQARALLQKETKK